MPHFDLQVTQGKCRVSVAEINVPPHHTMKSFLNKELLTLCQNSGIISHREREGECERQRERGGVRETERERGSARDREREGECERQRERGGV